MGERERKLHLVHNEERERSMSTGKGVKKKKKAIGEGVK